MKPIPWIFFFAYVLLLSSLLGMMWFDFLIEFNTPLFALTMLIIMIVTYIFSLFNGAHTETKLAGALLIVTGIIILVFGYIAWSFAQGWGGMWGSNF